MDEPMYGLKPAPLFTAEGSVFWEFFASSVLKCWKGILCWFISFVWFTLDFETFCMVYICFRNLLYGLQWIWKPYRRFRKPIWTIQGVSKTNVNHTKLLTFVFETFRMVYIGFWNLLYGLHWFSFFDTIAVIFGSPNNILMMGNFIMKFQFIVEFCV